MIFHSHHLIISIMYQFIDSHLLSYKYMGMSENGVPLNPMVNDHYPY